MNNLNDPPRWNVRPEAQGGADGGKWNYALLVPMLGLAAFRWIWKRESKKQIEKAKVQFDQDIAIMTKHLAENRRTVALLKLELKKERQWVQGYRKALEQEEEWQQRAQAQLQELEYPLKVRQSAFCSFLVPRIHRLKMEEDLLLTAAKHPLSGELGLAEDLGDIFRNDRHCADLLNEDKEKNGKLMWLYLRYWQLQVNLQKHKRAEEALKRLLPNGK